MIKTERINKEVTTITLNEAELKEAIKDYIESEYSSILLPGAYSSECTIKGGHLTPFASGWQDAYATITIIKDFENDQNP